MKVSEAKEKVCPFMQDGLILSYAIHDKKFFYEGQSVNCLCICGECMAWKYTIEAKYLNETSTDIVSIDEDEKEGYCSRLSNE